MRIEAKDLDGGSMLLGLLIAIGIFFLVLFIFKWAWNYVIPYLFNLPPITIWHALALFVVIGFLFGGLWAPKAARSMIW